MALSDLYKGRESSQRGIQIMKCWMLGALAFVVWLCVLCVQVRAEDPPPQDQNLITMNFQDRNHVAGESWLTSETQRTMGGSLLFRLEAGIVG